MDKIELTDIFEKGYKLSDFEHRILLDITKSSLVLFSSIVDIEINEEKLTQLNEELRALLMGYFETLLVICNGGSIRDYQEFFSVREKNGILSNQININKLMIEALKEINEAQDNNNR